MKKYIWKLCTRAWPEGQILPFWALVVRAILYPLNTFYWQMSKSRGYDWLTNNWNVDGVKWSGVALRHMASAQGVIFKITTTNGITTIETQKPQQ